MITYRFFKKIKDRAKRRGIEFKLTREYLIKLFDKQRGLSALSGIPLDRPFLDRINSNKPYQPGNVRWVLVKENLMKHQMKDEEFLETCYLIAKFGGK
jgi:hypothetical protein